MELAESSPCAVRRVLPDTESRMKREVSDRLVCEVRLEDPASPQLSYGRFWECRIESSHFQGEAWVRHPGGVRETAETLLQVLLSLLFPGISPFWGC
jgi:hypothetical protein